MTEEDLKAVDQLMLNRDHHLLHSEDFNRGNMLALCDKVPGLVAEVRRLHAFVDFADSNHRVHKPEIKCWLCLEIDAVRGTAEMRDGH
jgi:hypothetical protein